MFGINQRINFSYLGCLEFEAVILHPNFLQGESLYTDSFFSNNTYEDDTVLSQVIFFTKILWEKVREKATEI